MIQRIDINGIAGPMRAVFVPAGEKCPNHDDSHNKEDLLEFYDGRYPHTPDGQFISRYYLSTLRKDHELINMRGLDLWGGIDDWKIDARTVKLVLDWAAYHTYHKGAN
jgi:hypothetical protein